MNYKLENDQFTAQVKAHGAELCSVKNKKTEREYMWQADPAVWARHAPVLFPIVGKLNEDQYHLNGKTYRMTQHGFARDKDFQCTRQESEQLTFQLSADDSTRENYPFDFILNIHYQLSGSQLEIIYQVKNEDDQPMPFSIGAHPAFYCPAQKEKHWEEYELVFENNETLDRHLIENGLRNGQTKKMLSEEHFLPLHRHHFEDDAIIFYHVKSDGISIVAQSTGEKLVTVYCKDFPYLGIWQKLGANFYCIEPWCGLADKVGFTGGFTEREGVQILAPAQKFEISYTIAFH